MKIILALQLGFILGGVESFMFSKYTEDPDSLQDYQLGRFLVKWDVEEPYIQITTVADPDKIVFQTLARWPFLTAGFASESKHPILDGSFKAAEWVLYETPYQSIKSVHVSEDQIVISGEVFGLVTKADYVFRLILDSNQANQIKFEVDVTPTQGMINRIFLNYWCDPSESFHGFGLQYTYWNLKGRRVPIVVAEQGIGRGLQPITSALNYLADGAGGDWSTTYAPKPLYVTNQNRAMLFENSETIFFDLRDDDAVVVEIWGTSLSGYIFAGSSMLDLVEEITSVTGRMKPLPQWTQQGAVVGLEGGTVNVQNTVNTLVENGLQIAAVWLQDWVGLRHAFDGDRLVWNWIKDDQQYPGWTDMVQSWRKDNDIRVMTYVNPFFSNPSSYSTGSARDLFQEGIANGYFVHAPSGGSYVFRSGSIEFHMVDLTNPAARVWMKEIIKKEMIENTGTSGWMADFGEYLPHDAVLWSGESGASQHNLYPQQWAEVNQEAVAEYEEEVKLRDVAHESVDEIVYFMRSASLKTPGVAPLFWIGDQLVSWDQHDGIRSVLTSVLSGGIAGHSLTHSDIGGYTVEEIGPIHYTRSKVLLMRWTELSAFGSCLFRTHVGLSTSDNNAQIYTDAETMGHFSTFTDIFAHLADYRQELMQQAHLKGYPVMRPMAMHYPNDQTSWELTEQFLFGADFLVAPVMDPGIAPDYTVDVKVYIPANSVWTHLWSSRETSGGPTGRFIVVFASIGQPPVFYTKGSAAAKKLVSFLSEKGLLNSDGGDKSIELSKGEEADLDFPDYVKKQEDWISWLGLSQYADNTNNVNYNDHSV
eukprot:gene579-1117_t